MAFLASVSTSPPRYPSRKPPNFILPIGCSASSYSVLTATQFDLKTYWTTLIAEIDHELDEAIPLKYPERIYEAIRYSIMSKGFKRAPPVMCVAACEPIGGNLMAAFPTACTLEMFLFFSFQFEFFSFLF
ncbi:Geranylgeranyl pyrophosphate synthase [Quillaja saponaria]|uniref:Geranylgeranyl pyrophosphate synthase n=1 Tax=Quillaja saponaria TaxID=32244 RepID=A0AAD7VJX4_QUISA|nr:Geranylgeranyl pyrophosphate synthase [Quillaja saponaria]